MLNGQIAQSASSGGLGVGGAQTQRGPPDPHCLRPVTASTSPHRGLLGGGNVTSDGRGSSNHISPPVFAEGLKEYFCKFGEVKECMVMRDPVTKRSR